MYERTLPVFSSGSATFDLIIWLAACLCVAALIWFWDEH